jgi:flagellar biosynthesis/type III secretory pathway protein FliH
MALKSPVLSAAEASASVRPANLDRPLHRGSVEPQYSDPRLEELVRVAAARAREEAQAQGYLAGWAQGRQAATEESDRARTAQQEENRRLRAQITEEAQHLLEALRNAAREVREARLPEWDEVADALTDGALRIAQAALGRELRSTDNQVALSVRTALQHVAASGETLVHLSPDDAELLKDEVIEGLTVVPDPALSPGSVTVLTPTQRLRQDLPAAIAAAEEVLRS